MIPHSVNGCRNATNDEFLECPMLCFHQDSDKEKYMHKQMTECAPQTGIPHAARNRLASWMSFCWIVTRLACMAHRFASWNKLTRKASVASCKAATA